MSAAQFFTVLASFLTFGIVGVTCIAVVAILRRIEEQVTRMAKKLDDVRLGKPELTRVTPPPLRVEEDWP